MPVVLIKEECPHNHVCPLVEMCPVGAIWQQTPNDYPTVDADQCLECGVCVDSCLKGAMEMK